MDIKIEIGCIMSLIASFWKGNHLVPQNIQNFAVRAFSDQDDELMYAISSRGTAELMREGKSVEWLQNTIFQDNSDDHRVSLAKRQISEIENALREVICDVLKKIMVLSTICYHNTFQKPQHYGMPIVTRGAFHASADNPGHHGYKTKMPSISGTL